MVSVAMGRRSTGKSLSTTSTLRRVNAKSEARVWFASLSSTPTSAAYSFALCAKYWLGWCRWGVQGWGGGAGAGAGEGEGRGS